MTEATPPAGTAAIARIVQAILEAVAHGRLPAGTRLREEALATIFGVGRGPVREALKALAERGVDADVESPLPRLGVTGGADAVPLVSPMSSTTSLNVRCRMAVRSSRRCGALMPDAC